MTGSVRRFDPAGMRYPGMSQAVGCGDMILVSGQVALDGAAVVGAGDPHAQARQCFANIERVLAEAGATLADVVSLRCFVVGPDAYAGYAAVKLALFGEAPPASTAVIVAGLLLPELLMEVEAVAWRSTSATDRG